MDGNYYILFSDGCWASCPNKESISDTIGLHKWLEPANGYKAMVIQNPVTVPIKEFN